MTELTDPHADPNERLWRVELARNGGIKVSVYDDAGQLFDELRLYRFGAFIAFDLRYHGPTILPGFEWLRNALEAKHRLGTVGISGPQLPVLVHSEVVRKAFELGYLPVVLAKTFPAFGSIMVQGLRVVWSRDLDHLSEPT